MTRGDTMKFCLADSCGANQRAIDHRPADLQSAQIALRERAPRQISCDDWQLFRSQCPKVICEHAAFLEFERSCADRFANVSELEELRILFDPARRRIVHARARALPRRQLQLHLVFFAQGPGFDFALAQIARKLSRETMER